MLNHRGQALWEKAEECHLLAFSPVQSALLALSHTLQLWDAATGHVLAEYPQFKLKDIRGAGFLRDWSTLPPRTGRIGIWQLDQTQTEWPPTGPWAFPAELPNPLQEHQPQTEEQPEELSLCLQPGLYKKTCNFMRPSTI